jgi:hypothetical protein
LTYPRGVLSCGSPDTPMEYERLWRVT